MINHRADDRGREDSWKSSINNRDGEVLILRPAAKIGPGQAPGCLLHSPYVDFWYFAFLMDVFVSVLPTIADVNKVVLDCVYVARKPVLAEAPPGPFIVIFFYTNPGCKKSGWMCFAANKPP